jgi:phosphoribosylanthranilate isomerase
MTLGVKICGLTTAESLDAAIAGGAEFVGFVFHGRSPRHIAMPLAADLAARARSGTKIVALTVNADDTTLDSIVVAVNPDFLQLHGDETVERIEHLKARHRLPIIKAVAVGARSDAEHARPFVGVADIILFDAKPQPGSDLAGGNGLAFDWGLLGGVSTRMRFMLSGGLTPGNVGEAIKATGASGVDVSSGVEVRRGVKDVTLIRRFLDAAHASLNGPD